MTDKPLLIALGHKRRRGKNTIASLIRSALINDHNFRYSDVTIESFAAPIRHHILWGVFGLSPEDIEKYKSVPVPGIGLTTRELLQRIGTDYFRKTYGSNIWVKAFERAVLSKDSRVVIVADLRFPEEVDLIRDHDGILIRVDREIPHAPEDNHISETVLDSFDGWDFVLDNNMTQSDMVFELRDVVKKILHSQR